MTDQRPRRCFGGWLASGVALLLAWASVARVQDLRAEQVARRSLPENSNRSGGRAGSAKARPGRDDPAAAISGLAVSPARNVTFTVEREAAALAFVRKNRPELEPLLNKLKLSKPAEYQQTIYDLFRTSELFAVMRQEDPARSELALKAWQVKARTELLAADLVAHPDQRERITADLQQAVEEQVNLEIDQAAHEVERLQAKLHRAEGQRKQMEARRAELVEQRLGAVLQAVTRVESEQSETSKAAR